jgi:hypothetical protein
MKIGQFRPRSVPAALLIYCILSFGLLIPWLGFYWDDWPSIYYLHVLGPRGFIDAFASDRPSLGWLFMTTSAVIGQSTLGWQLFGLLTRWLCSLSLWGLLRFLWPDHSRQVTWVALLFAAYPGFLQQYIAVTYSHTWLVLCLFFVSLTLMIAALRTRKWFWPWMTLSGLLAAFCMFTDEYYFGLELLRPLILFMAGGWESKGLLRRMGKTALHWLPYLLLMVVFLFWRLVLHQSPRGQVQVFDKVAVSPVDAVLDLGEEVLQDSYEASLLAWGQVLNIPRYLQGGSGAALLYGAAVLVGTLLAFLYLKSFTANGLPPTAQPAWRWPVQAIGIGIFALLVGGIPFWVTNLPIDLRFPWDRFTLALNLGASLLLLGLLELLVRPRLANVIVLSCLLGLAAGFHVQLANVYRREWNAQQAFFWQLVWRAPAIQPGSLILTAELPFTYYSDNSLTAPLNWTYAPQSTSRQMPYLLFNIESRLGGSLSGFDTGQIIEEDYRALSFSGSTSQSLAIYSSPPGCVKVVDPITDARTPQKPLYFSKVLPLSNPGLIQPHPAQEARPPAAYFGSEPEHGWCYFFEKADLARQLGEWEQVVRLAEQAFAQNPRLYEVNAPELIPYIEGFAYTGKWERARELTREAYKLTFRMNRILCDTWGRIGQATGIDPDGQATIEAMQAELKCER